MGAGKFSIRLVLGVGFAIGGAALAEGDTQEIAVGNVTELVTALSVAVAGQDGVYKITLNPGEYDFSTCEESQHGNFWGVNYGDDGNGVSCLQVKREVVLQGKDETHYSKKTREQETVLKGAGRILYLCSASGARSSVFNITFEGGVAPGNSTGGGILVTSDGDYANQGLISNCVFRACRSSFRGGAVSGVKAVDCLFEGNGAGQGGASNKGLLENCVFTENTASESYGSALRDSIAVGCEFKKNGSGSVYNSSVTNSIFYVNPVHTAHGSEARNSSLYGCRFLAQNVGVTNDARSVVYGGTVANCVIGPLRLTDKNSVVCNVEYIRNTLFSECVAKNLIYNNAGLKDGDGNVVATDIANCTFVDNALNTVNGGLVFSENAGATCRVYNTICAGNKIDYPSSTHHDKSADLAVRTYNGGVAMVSHSLCKTLPPAGMVASGVLDGEGVRKGVDPLFVDKSDFPEMPYLISKRSPARNAGVYQEWMASAKDLAGIARIAEGAVDMGCYEWGYTKCGLVLVFR